MTDKPTPEPTYTLPPDTVFHAPVAPHSSPVFEVAFYVYKKLDPNAPASWPNSGVQDLIAFVPGTDWFTEFPGDLPAYVCGPGWGVQQDKVSHDGTFVWPESIEYPHDNIGWPPIYAAQHFDLETFVTVPDCVTSTEQPTSPPVQPALAATGGEWVLIAAIGFSLLAMGFAFLAAKSLSKRPRYRRSPTA